MERVVVRERVRWSDVDQLRVVYFGKYLRFLEAAEAEFFRACGFGYGQIDETFGVSLVRVHLEMDFRKPAILDDELDCWAELRRIGGSSLHFVFPIERAGERIVDITLILAAVGTTTLRPERVPDALRAALAGRLTPPE